MSPRVAIIVQARMSSTRLPGKVLMPLAGAPSIVRTMERLAKVQGATEVLVATSVDGSDDALFDTCVARGIRCIRGPLEDVLSRYEVASHAANAEIVVRVTGDCPLIDPSTVDRCIALFQREATHVDYASNVDERTFPVGLDTEVFFARCLDEAAASTTDPFEREHVTPWLRRHKRKVSLCQPVNLADLRWTLDYPEDYRAIASIYDALWQHDTVFSAEDVYRLLVSRPVLLHTATRQPLGEAERGECLTRIHRHLSLVTAGAATRDSAPR